MPILCHRGLQSPQQGTPPHSALAETRATPAALPLLHYVMLSEPVLRFWVC